MSVTFTLCSHTSTSVHMQSFSLSSTDSICRLEGFSFIPKDVMGVDANKKNLSSPPGSGLISQHASQLCHTCGWPRPHHVSLKEKHVSNVKIKNKIEWKFDTTPKILNFSLSNATTDVPRDCTGLMVIFHLLYILH